MAPQKTLIKGSFIIAFDGRNHRYLRDGELVFQGPEILFVGPKYDGTVDKTIDASGKIVSPGFISTHAHLFESPMDRSFVEDRGNPQFYYSGFTSTCRSAGRRWTARCARCVWNIRSPNSCAAEQQRSWKLALWGGCPAPGSSLRQPCLLRADLSLGQMVYSGRQASPLRMGQRRRLRRTGESRGVRKKIRRRLRRPDSRIFMPCSSGYLFRKASGTKPGMGPKIECAAADHVSQSVIEFQEMLRRHGKTPIAWLDDIGFLQKNVILSHAIIIGGTSWANYPPGI